MPSASGGQSGAIKAMRQGSLSSFSLDIGALAGSAAALSVQHLPRSLASSGRSSSMSGYQYSNPSADLSLQGTSLESHARAFLRHQEKKA